MKRINISYILLSCILLAFSACSDIDEQLTGMGILRLGVETNNVVVTKATALKHQFTITSNTDGWSKQYDYSEPITLKLKAGSYAVVASVGDDNNGIPAFDMPHYSNKATVAIKEGEDKSQKITCTMTKTLISVVYGDDVKEKFAGYNYQTVVSDGSNELTYGPSESRIGYFAPSKLSVCFRYNAGGEWIEFQRNAPIDAKTRFHYTLKLSVKDNGEVGTIGAGDIQIEIEETNDREETIDVKLPRSTSTPNAWARFAWLKGEIEAEVDLSDVYFEWRKKGEETWIEEHTVERVEGNYQALIKELDPNTDYECRIARGNTVGFKTENIPFVPNLNFNTWTMIMGGSNEKWYPNAEAENTFWATGNDGVTMVMNSTTVGVETDRPGAEGKHAKLTSVSIAFVGFAAGNLYTGEYETIMSNPIASAKFGRDYSGRPTKLRGWFKYKPKTINITHENYPQYAVHVGSPDHCEIYVRLFQGDIYSADELPLGDREIAYGSFSTNEDITEWKEFEFPIVYTDLEAIPTKIAIVATSSKYGAFFTGGVGSELCIDDFELSFDYDDAILGE